MATSIDPALEGLIVFQPTDSKTPPGWATASDRNPASDTTQAQAAAAAALHHNHHDHANSSVAAAAASAAADAQNIPQLAEAAAATLAIAQAQRKHLQAQGAHADGPTPAAAQTAPPGAGSKRRTRTGNPGGTAAANAAAVVASAYPNPSSLTGVATTSTTPSTPVQLDHQQMLQANPALPRTSCPQPTGKIKNQLQARKSIAQALADCGEDQTLKHAVLAAVNCEEYKQNKAVPAQYLTPLTETVGLRAQSRCRFPGCGKMSVRTDRAKEHARVHIGNHPYACERIQSDGRIGCGATFLRKHDRNRHNAGADLLTCEACGANIQGKGREYNLQRHRTNYCPVMKAQKAAAMDSILPAQLSGAAGGGNGGTGGAPGSSAAAPTSKRGRKNQQHANGHGHGIGGAQHHIGGILRDQEMDDIDIELGDLDGEAEDEDGVGDMA